jgi:thiol:disulfide interchange protein DsbD
MVGSPALRALTLAAGIACFAGDAAAQVKLLEPERAFAFSVQAIDDSTAEARFTVADGYYLYRDKLKFSVTPSAVVSPPVLPAGEVKEDAFFGRVETYRGRVAVKLALDKPQPGRQVTVRAESQGCADAGVCYPPQVQTVTLPLPAAGTPPGAPVAATPARKSWFN